MTSARCRWCGRPAADQCRAKGNGQPVVVPYCGPDTECWERTYQEVRRYPERTWSGIERPKRRAQSGPDLFDLLPEGQKPA
jgi:hypothetical protein